MAVGATIYQQHLLAGPLGRAPLCLHEKQSQVYHEVQPDQPRTERARAFLLGGLTLVGASCRDSVSVPVAWGEARFLGRVGGEVLTPRGHCGKPRQPRAPPT